jgi:hypothetical protein
MHPKPKLQEVLEQTYESSFCWEAEEGEQGGQEGRQEGRPVN